MSAKKKKKNRSRSSATDPIRCPECAVVRALSDGDNFTQSVSSEKWLGVVKSETDWWILVVLPRLISGQRDINTRKCIIRYRIESWNFLFIRSERMWICNPQTSFRDANVCINMELEIG
ncbi:hypothetical protein CEXT_425951 [Caerostris extrusa]|uniref:Uncharacterized protein n=1 Tax=Caerostris extrusa TaxID=172846 RepID=A0AAV4NVM6_CAEEX|nr:hypothetical protein CEXT_425951 [Caerostris extrusa]